MKVIYIVFTIFLFLFYQSATAQELKQQLEVAEGEDFAVNNNPELLKEIHRLLWTMNSVGLLSGKVALEHFKDIKRIYF